MFDAGLQRASSHGPHAAHLVARVDGAVAAREDVDDGAHDGQAAPLRVVRELRAADPDRCNHKEHRFNVHLHEGFSADQARNDEIVDSFVPTGTNHVLVPKHK